MRRLKIKSIFNRNVNEKGKNKFKKCWVRYSVSNMCKKILKRKFFNTFQCWYKKKLAVHVKNNLVFRRSVVNACESCELNHFVVKIRAGLLETAEYSVPYQFSGTTIPRYFRRWLCVYITKRYRGLNHHRV